MSLIEGMNKSTQEHSLPPFGTARTWARIADCSPSSIKRHIRPIGIRGRAKVYAREDVERWMRGEPVATQVHHVTPDLPRVKSDKDESLNLIASIAKGGAK